MAKGLNIIAKGLNIMAEGLNIMAEGLNARKIKKKRVPDRTR
jgi:hypothetical protein